MSRLSSSQSASFEYDVALSFAKEDASLVEQYAEKLRLKGVNVYFYKWSLGEGWGSDARKRDAEIYRRKAKYCVIFLSEAYLKNDWTIREFEIALERLFQDGEEYILPVRLDDTPFPGLPKHVIYHEFKPDSDSVDKLVEVTIEKLASLSDPSRSEVDKDVWAEIQDYLTDKAERQITEIADHCFRQSRRPNYEAAIDAFKNGLTASQAAVLDRPENLHKFVELAGDFRKRWILEVDLAAQPQQQDVEKAFHRTVCFFWAKRGRAFWLIAMAVVALVFTGIGFAAAIALWPPG